MIAVVVVAAGLLSACSGGLPGSTALTTSVTSTQLTAPTSNSPSQSRLIDFRNAKGKGVVITKVGQAYRKLPGAPKSFQDYIDHRVKQDLAAGMCGDWYRVDLVHLSGWAYGAFDACGINMSVWKKSGGSWDVAKAWISGDPAPCRRLHRIGVPDGLVPECA